MNALSERDGARPSEHGGVPPFEHGGVPPFEHGGVPPFEHGGVPPSEHGGVPPDILVSVIIPARNEAGNISRCLQSVLHQEGFHGRIEAVLVDNGSTDATPVLAAESGALVAVLPGVSIAALRNHGAAMARGSVLAFVDGDMEMPPGWLLHVTELLRQGWRAVGLVTRLPDEYPALIRIWDSRNDWAGRAGLKSVDYLPSTNLVVTRSAFETVGGFDPNLRTGEDKDFVLRLTERGLRCVRTSRLTALHRSGETSLSVLFRKEYWRQSGALALALKHGLKPRLLRFPLFCLALFWALAVAAGLLPFAPALSGLLAAAALGAGFAAGLARTRRMSGLKNRLLVALLSLPRFCIAGLGISVAALRPSRHRSANS